MRNDDLSALRHLQDLSPLSLVRHDQLPGEAGRLPRATGLHHNLLSGPSLPQLPAHLRLESYRLLPGVPLLLDQGRPLGRRLLRPQHGLARGRRPGGDKLGTGVDVAGPQCGGQGGGDDLASGVGQLLELLSGQRGGSHRTWHLHGVAAGAAQVDLQKKERWKIFFTEQWSI